MSRIPESNSEAQTLFDSVHGLMLSAEIDSPEERLTQFKDGEKNATEKKKTYAPSSIFAGAAETLSLVRDAVEQKKFAITHVVMPAHDNRREQRATVTLKMLDEEIAELQKCAAQELNREKIRVALNHAFREASNAYMLATTPAMYLAVLNQLNTIVESMQANGVKWVTRAAVTDITVHFHCADKVKSEIIPTVAKRCGMFSQEQGNAEAPEKKAGSAAPVLPILHWR